MAELLEHGYAASTMTRVAERAGIAKGTPYRYYPSKEALFLDMMRTLVTDPLREVRNQPFAPGESVAAYCRRTLLPIMQVIEQSGRAAIARLALTESRSFPELTEAYRRDVFLPFHAHLTGLAARAISAHEISAAMPADTDADQLAHLLTSPLWMGLVRNGILTPDTPLGIAALFEIQIDLIFDQSPRERPAGI